MIIVIIIIACSIVTIAIVMLIATVLGSLPKKEDPYVDPNIL